MYQTILAAVDLSELSLAVFKQALQLTKFCGAKLILLHVLSSDEEGFPILATFPYDHFEPTLAEGYLESWRQLEQKGLQHLKTFADHAQQEGIKIETLQMAGNPGQIIRDLARDRAVNLIMMGNRGRSGLSELLLGSQSNYVMHHAPCSVQVVKVPVPKLEPLVATANLTKSTGN
ncbi:Putative universal stress protein [Acaryochloris thomasi RCC1774]|uniref:Universal stress protein n=1 Tax=Acaryochloris thomasi RCC1774 TaxID=1764569 RepID=A0A2W1JNV4_9CYAN|nr:universal stress protein [Acaryochloris thomasi]PZD70931.1 Putative universal stress protein [Acaryochloris thomasi RCC1774]